MGHKENTIVITGAAGGIGQACVRNYKNHKIVITDYSQDMVDNTVEKFKKEDFDILGIACDITSDKDIAELTQFVEKQGPMKALIHTAGVSGTVKDTRKVYDIDLAATEKLVNAFYELIDKGSVAVLLSSMMAHTVLANKEYDDALSNPLEDNSYDIINSFVKNDSDTMYNFAKRGVCLLTQKHANKWGEKGARIVSISPGVIETPMALKAAEEHPERMELIKQATPLKRNGQPEDIADVVQFLTSDAARFITSTDILVDGGVVHNIKKMY